PHGLPLRGADAADAPRRRRAGTRDSVDRDQPRAPGRDGALVSRGRRRGRRQSRERSVAPLLCRLGARAHGPGALPRRPLAARRPRPLAPGDPQPPPRRYALAVGRDLRAGRRRRRAMAGRAGARRRPPRPRRRAGGAFMSGAAIELDGLSKLYDSSRGIQDLTMSVEQGEVFGFLGPNGAGKTTTIRTLLDLLHPTSGQARIFGLDSHRERPAIHARLGNLPGDFAYD